MNINNPADLSGLISMQWRTDKVFARSTEGAIRKMDPFYKCFSCDTQEWLDKYITVDPAMIAEKEKVQKLQPHRDPVLIIGPTGTGKELLAHALHGSRDKYPGGKFVSVNCTALPSELLESELFGHKKGAFTGALEDRVGKFRAAYNGTLFLDEIGDMPLDMQAKLLRVIQEMKVTPLGEDKEVEINCRIVAATNKTEEELLNKCHFREDLYHRLAVFTIRTTPLSARPEDIDHIVDSLGGDKIPRDGGVIWNISGNVRSLQAQVRRWQVLGTL